MDVRVKKALIGLINGGVDSTMTYSAHGVFAELSPIRNGVRVTIIKDGVETSRDISNKFNDDEISERLDELVE